MKLTELHSITEIFHHGKEKEKRRFSLFRKGSKKQSEQVSNEILSITENDNMLGEFLVMLRLG